MLIFNDISKCSLPFLHERLYVSLQYFLTANTIPSCSRLKRYGLRDLRRAAFQEASVEKIKR